VTLVQPYPRMKLGAFDGLSVVTPEPNLKKGPRVKAYSLSVFKDPASRAEQTCVGTAAGACERRTLIQDWLSWGVGERICG
jgi:hypothetical protein